MTFKWAKPTNARNLVAQCAEYVIPEDEFTDVELIGSGHALVLSRAVHRGQRVVIKRWHAALLDDKARVVFTKRLVRELDSWRRVSHHPNIAPVLGVALHISSLPALVVPELRTVMQALTEDSTVDILRLMQGTASALLHLHTQSPPLVHGDLKGSTVFVSPSGTALLCDIGIAQIPQPPEWTFSGVEDARWLAPEIMDVNLRPCTGGRGDPEEAWDADGGRTPEGRMGVTCESDVYSFGMLGYQMHTRTQPFASLTWPASVVVHVVSARGRPLRPSVEQSPQLSDEMWELIQSCWKHEWDRRPTMKAIAAWLAVLERVRAVDSSLSASTCASTE
ncbi:kinase-like domain-containing protein [Roridomyces roridus]|uniref:Kinase-like domain-containing protein n=1 Tax=Roridomyces roridus TaxID=1738132 RepID=A0AAD7FBQ5_9AGAR|nr:kinase-like domain-containing protein [Roridomyces roridus]